ncbi:hypothetical protein NKG94_14560 [Micromonospora sp. M12]
MLAHADEVTRVLAGWSGPLPQPRVMLRTTAAILTCGSPRLGGRRATTSPPGRPRCWRSSATTR